MELKLIKTETDYNVMVKTNLTEKMFNVVSREAKQLKDKDGNVVFALDWSNDGHPVITRHGAVLSGQSFSFNRDYEDDEEIELARLELAQVKDKATKIEKQIIKEYNALVSAAEEIAVEEF